MNDDDIDVPQLLDYVNKKSGEPGVKQLVLGTTKVKKSPKQWLKEVDANPERFKVSAEHIKRVNRRVAEIETNDDKERVKRGQKEIEEIDKGEQDGLEN